MRRLLCSGLCLFTFETALAAPYPADGLVTEWVQPGGEVLGLRMYGDEFYARTTNADGYTVIFSAVDNAYYYADSAATGMPLISSGVKAHKPPPAGLARQLKEPPEVVSAVNKANVQKFAPDRAAKWNQQKTAVKQKRARAAAQLDPAARETSTLGSQESRSIVISGNRVGLMLLVQFPDDPATPGLDAVNFPTTQVKMNRYSNEVGYTDDGNTGSIREYFSDQSLGNLNFTQVVPEIITLPHPRNYYNFANYPTNTVFLNFGIAGRRLMADAIAILQSNGFDFSTLSVDSSNAVYATSLMFAGNLSGVWSQGLWPHAWLLSSPLNVGTSSNPRYIRSYQATNVPNAAPVIGTMCHELGHLVLNYPDFYDTDSSDGASQGVGEHSLMGSGNFLNGGRTPAPIDLYLKDFSGWATITDLPLDVATERSLAADGYGYRIRKPASSTEYFLIENRSNDDRWANSSPAKGIVVWHVDEAVTTDNKRQQMTAFQHYELSLEQADGLFDLERNRNRGDNKDLFDSFKIFNSSTMPGSRWWSDAASNVRMQVLNPPGTPLMHLRFFSDVVQLPMHEALDTEGLVWSEDGLVFAQGSWLGELSSAAQDGVDHARNYPVADSEEASVFTQLSGPGSLSFWWKVSSEPNGDYLAFFRDNQQQRSAPQISGEVGWQQRRVPIPAGVHTLRWTYAKNAVVAAGSDTGWLDQVVFTPGPVDSDGDGLSDDDEVALATNPNSVDTDSDGLVDGAGGLVPIAFYPGGIDSNDDGFVDGEADLGTDSTASNIGDLAPRGAPDNVIDLGDRVILTRFVNGLSQPTAVEFALADIDRDGDIDTGDLILLQQVLMSGSTP